MNPFSKRSNTQRVFLDYASTTPVAKDVVLSMKQFQSDKFYNPSSLYKEAVEIKNIIKDAKVNVSKVLHVKESELFFTGSGTESNNLAILGLFKQAKENGISNPHIIVSKIEHPSVLETAKEIEKQGGEVTFLNVSKRGKINIDELVSSIKENTILISIIYVNNEIGVIQSIRKISSRIGHWKTENNRENKNYPFFHSDASQAPLYVNCNIDALGVDLLTLDGSKIYGPKGVGLLVKKYYVDIQPIMYGGNQEKGLRPGTENVPLIIGFSTAIVKAQKTFEENKEKVGKLRDYFINKVIEEIPNAKLNGSKKDRVANNINICIPGINAEFTVIKLDEKGVACASTTACKNLDDESASYVVEALGDDSCSTSSLRFTLGLETTKGDIDYVIGKLKECINLL